MSNISNYVGYLLKNIHYISVVSDLLKITQCGILIICNLNDVSFNKNIEKRRHTMNRKEALHNYNPFEKKEHAKQNNSRCSNCNLNEKTCKFRSCHSYI